MTNSIRNLLFTLLIITLLETTTAGPVAYAACIAQCMGSTSPFGGIVYGVGADISAICAGFCAPLLVAPQP